MTPEEEEARDRLLFHLENQTGFWFALVVSEDAGPRDRLREAAEQWCKEHGRAFFLHEPDPRGLVKLAVSLVGGEHPGVHWICADGMKGVIESWNAGAAQMLMAMNERREAYRKRFEGGIILAGRTSLKRILRETAPDLFSIRAFVTEPGRDRPSLSSDFPVWRPPAPEVMTDPDLALLKLARIPAPKGPELPMDWILAEAEAILCLLDTERYAEAEDHAQSLKSRLDKASTDTGGRHVLAKSFACHVLAAIAFIKDGNAEKALQLWDEGAELMSSLPVKEERTSFPSVFVLQMLHLRARALIATGNLEAARDALEEYVRSLPNVNVDELTPGGQIDFMSAYIELANVLERQHQTAAEAEVLRKAVSMAEEYSARHPGDLRWQLEVLRSRTALGHAELMRFDPSDGDLRSFHASLETLIPAADLANELLEHGAAGEPLNGVLLTLFSHLAFLLSFQSNYSKTIDHVRAQALTYVQGQFDGNPSDADLGWSLAGYYLHRTKLLETEDPAGAKESAGQAMALVAKLPVTEERANLKREIESLRAFAPRSRKKKRTKSN